jgi:diguanylate cyclase (GGDEF)-like protein
MNSYSLYMYERNGPFVLNLLHEGDELRHCCRKEATEGSVMTDLQSGKVGQLVKKGGALVTIRQDVTIAVAAQEMSQRNVGSALVCDEAGHFAGIVTERDILKKVAARGLDAGKVCLRDILTSEIVSCTMDSPISMVEELMHGHKIRHIPVMENGEPVAILSSRDVIAYQIVRTKDMKMAAEQIARMSIELKSSDFDQLSTWAVTEVLKLFSATSAVLWIEPDADALESSGFVAKSGCQCRESDIFGQIASCKTSHGAAFAPTQQNTTCSGHRDCSHSLVIPLKLSQCTKDSRHGVEMKSGFLCICGFKRNGIEADEVTLYKASLLSEILSASLTNALLYREYSEAKSQSLTDPLTGLGTRRVFESEVENEYSRARRYSRPFCIAVMDIDKFKLINDGAGHAAGDEVLKRVAHTIQRMKRTTDVAVRYGGDEMVLLMPETDQSHGMLVAERLRATIEEESRSGSGPSVTISCGLAQWSAEHEELAGDVFKRADSALYEAKKAGRNRVCFSNPETVAV